MVLIQIILGLGGLAENRFHMALFFHSTLDKTGDWFICKCDLELCYTSQI